MQTQKWSCNLELSLYMRQSRRRGDRGSGLSPTPSPENSKFLDFYRIVFFKKDPLIPWQTLSSSTPSPPENFCGSALVIITFTYRGWKNRKSNSKWKCDKFIYCKTSRYLYVKQNVYKSVRVFKVYLYGLFHFCCIC